MTASTPDGPGAGIELRAHAKLTLELRVTGVRDDGYHLIDAEMASSLMNDTAYASTIHHNLAKAAGIIAGLVREYSEDVAEMPEEESESPAGQRQRVARLMRESQRDIDRAVEEMRQSR